MTIETIIEILGAIGAGAIITKLMEKRKTKAEINKIDTEANQITLSDELKLVTFYRTELDNSMKANKLLMESNLQCEARLNELERKYNELQRQFTLLKMENFTKNE